MATRRWRCERHLGCPYDASIGHRGSCRTTNRGRSRQSAANAGVYEVAHAVPRRVGADPESAVAKDFWRVAAPPAGAVEGRRARALAQGELPAGTLRGRCADGPQGVSAGPTDGL